MYNHSYNANFEEYPLRDYRVAVQESEKILSFACVGI